MERSTYRVRIAKKQILGRFMQNYKRIRVEQWFDNAVRVIILANGKGNIIDKEMMKEIGDTLDLAEKDSDLKAILFRGDGGHFSFGASVPEHVKEAAPVMLREFHSIFRRIIDMAIPSIAIIHGQCLGGGMELALFSNWIFADEHARFGQPEIGLAVFAPVASLLLPSLIGQSAADDLLITGRSVSATHAKAMGLIHDVSSDPEKNARFFIEQHLLPKSAKALRFAVRASRFQFSQNFLHHLQRLETMYLNELMNTSDANEGIQAFLEKRTPHWKNS